LHDCCGILLPFAIRVKAAETTLEKAQTAFDNEYDKIAGEYP